ncbi:MAG: SpoIIE family protein phosphatase [Ignavibacteriota bacterium]
MKAGTIVSMIKILFASSGARMDMKTFFNQSSETLKGIELGRLMMAFIMLKIKLNKIEFANAGMPPLFIYRKTTKTVEEVMLNSMPLGAMKNFPHEIEKLEISTSDTLLLLSDGLPELKNNNVEQYGGMILTN